MDEKPIQIVDEHDKPIGQASKAEMWRDGLRHRVVRIMAVRSDGAILLQKRASTKQPFPDCWDNSAAGHVDAGEDYLTAAKRELAEELGLHDIPLQELGAYTSSNRFEWRKMNRFVRVYRIRLETLPRNIERTDIAEVRWFTRAEIEKMLAEHPEQATDGLQDVIQKGFV